MQKKKWVQRIAALGTGALMLGATLTGALAQADLSDYPQPFIQDGVLTDTVIVVGQGAAASDVIGAVDIAADLQAEAVLPAGDSGGVVTTVTEGVQVSTSGADYVYGTKVADVDSRFDEDDLDFLAEGEFEDEDFSQELVFGSAAGEFTFNGAQRQDNYEMDAGDFLEFEEGDLVYTYNFEFDTGARPDDDHTDWETEVIEIQGVTYTIHQVDTYADGNISEITLLAGETVESLLVDEPLTIERDGEEVTLTLVDVMVEGNDDVCLISIDGQIEQAEVGKTISVGGLEIGATKVFAGAGDYRYCQVNIGAGEIVLEDGGNVVVNNDEIQGSAVTIDSTANEWDGFTVVYTVDEDDFEDHYENFGQAQYIAPTEAWIDPVFGNFKVLFGGVDGDYEDMSFTTSTDEGVFTFNDVEGDEVEIEFFVTTGGDVEFGYDADRQLYYEGTVDVATNNKNPRFLVVTSTTAQEAHIIEFQEYDDDEGELVFDDLVKDGEDLRVAVTADAANAAVNLEDVGTIYVNWSSADETLTFDLDSSNVALIETEHGAEVDLHAGGATDAVVELLSLAGDSDAQGSTSSFNVTLAEDTGDSDDIVEIQSPASSEASWVGSGDEEYDTDNTPTVYVSAKGIKFVHDDDREYLDVMWPEDDVVANVFVAPMGAALQGGVVTGDAVTVNPFEVGIAVLDTEAENMNRNMIVVGGPCANTIAAELMGNPENCAEGFEPGMAMLKYFDRNGNVALLVAGAEAQDTRAASYALASPESFSGVDLAGDEVEVVVTSLDEITTTTV